MTWFYLQNGERVGPIENPALTQLAAQGVITPATLVWREGLTEWTPYSRVIVGDLTGATGKDITCTECNGTFPLDQLINLGRGPVCANCKASALEKLREGVTANAEAIGLRTQHINHESSLRSVGWLYLLGGSILTITGIVTGILTLSQAASSLESKVEGAGGGSVLILLGALQFWGGWQLRRLKPVAKIPVGILSGLGLLGFPLGTLINGYILYLVFSKKGRFIFSPEYRALIAATPGVKCRTSVVAWILLGLVVLGAIVAVVVFSGISG